MTTPDLFDFPIKVNPDLHPGVVEIVDPDSDEVLGGFVLDGAGAGHLIEPGTLHVLRRYPACHVGTQRPLPWRVDTPVYAEVVDALGLDPLALDGRTWLDTANGTVAVDDGHRWVPVASER